MVLASSAWHIIDGCFVSCDSELPMLSCYWDWRWHEAYAALAGRVEYKHKAFIGVLNLRCTKTCFAESSELGLISD